MRVLVVHNRYSSRVPSGENLAVDDEVRWLRDAGVDVARHEVSNDDMVHPGLFGRAIDGGDALWSVRARRRFLDVLDDVQPDVVHVHNLFPLLTGSVPRAARSRGLPVVWTVHNRRVRCVAGGYFRAGAPCHQCRPGWRAPGIAHRCYAGSAVASALVTASSSAFRATARRDGVVAVAVSQHMAGWLASAGFDPARVRVKYNAVEAAGPARSDPAAQQLFVFAGRLAHYKGVRLLLDAWRQVPAATGATLRIVGDGDAADEVRAAVAADSRIEWAGHVAPAEVAGHLAAARAVLVPSLWDEPFGRVAAEAFAHGRPVITTGRGGLAEIVDSTTGWVTGGGEPAPLAEAIVAAAGSDDAVRGRGGAALARHADRFSPGATTAALLGIYDDVCRDGRAATGGR